MVTAFSVTAIQGLEWLKLILSILNIGVFIMVTFVTAHKTAQDEARIKHSNDIQRRIVVETGDYYDFDTLKEYKKNKGFILGIYVSAILVIFLLLKFIFSTAGVDASFFDNVLLILYATFVVPLKTYSDTASLYFAIYGVAVIILSCGLGYEVGARSKQRVYDRIDKINEQIHGKKK